MSNRWIMILTLILVFILGTVGLVSAFDVAKTGLKDTASNAGYGDTQNNLMKSIGNVINVVLSLMGVFLFLIILYGGYLYMTSAGEVAKLKEAKGWIFNGIIGMVIILLSYALTTFILSKLSVAVGGTTAATSAILFFLL